MVSQDSVTESDDLSLLPPSFIYIFSYIYISHGVAMYD